MSDQFSRTELLFGNEGMMKLFAAKVAVFGVGGVGGYAVEALARSGVGRIDVFDHDIICPTNLNRQLHALYSNIGKYKVDVVKERIRDINPGAIVNAFKLFYLPETSAQVDLSEYDYVIDAIDTISGKIELVVNANNHGIPIISSMGAGNKIEPAAFEVADIYSTSVCPVAKVMRHELRRRGVKRLKVVYTKEPPIKPQAQKNDAPESKRRSIPGSTAFVPSVVGLIIAGEVVKDIL
jgi:tRNA A37 threonylcarbamoyladenosine dehydratase